MLNHFFVILKNSLENKIRNNEATIFQTKFYFRQYFNVNFWIVGDYLIVLFPL